MSALSSDDIDAFVQVFEASDWDQIDVALEGVELHLSRSIADGTRLVMRSRAEPGVPPVAVDVGDVTAVDIDDVPTASPALVDIVAPHVGTFLRAAEPGGPPLVETGQRVHRDTAVCTLKVMNTFSSVLAGVEGVIRDIRPMTGALVDAGEILFLVESDLGTPP